MLNFNSQSFSARRIFQLPGSKPVPHLLVDTSSTQVLKFAAGSLVLTPRAIAALLASRYCLEVNLGPYSDVQTSAGATLTHTFTLGNNIGPVTVFGVMVQCTSSNQVTLGQVVITVTGRTATRESFAQSDTLIAGPPGPGGNNAVRAIMLPFNTQVQGNSVYCPLVFAGAGVAPYPTSTAIDCVVTVAGLPTGAVSTVELLTCQHPDIQAVAAELLSLGGIGSRSVSK